MSSLGGAPSALGGTRCQGVGRVPKAGVVLLVVLALLVWSAAAVAAPSNYTAIMQYSTGMDAPVDYIAAVGTGS
jgi:hypothetical protein